MYWMSSVCGGLSGIWQLPPLSAKQVANMARLLTLTFFFSKLEVNSVLQSVSVFSSDRLYLTHAEVERRRFILRARETECKQIRLFRLPQTVLHYSRDACSVSVCLHRTQKGGFSLVLSANQTPRIGRPINIQLTLMYCYWACHRNARQCNGRHPLFFTSK